MLAAAYLLAPYAYNKAFVRAWGLKPSTGVIATHAIAPAPEQFIFVCDEFPEQPPFEGVDDPPTESVLAADYRVKCNSDDADFADITRTGWAIIILFAVVLPASYAALLLSARKPIVDEMVVETKLSSALRFLYRDFKPRCMLPLRIFE